MQIEKLDFKVNQIVCREGDESRDLLFLESGELLVCTVAGTQVKAIATIGPGQFFGELSFFDGKPRSSFVVARTECSVIQFPKTQLLEQLPQWFLDIGRNVTKKIRLLDEVIHSSNIRKYGTGVKPLSIDQQCLIYNAIANLDS